MAAVHENVRILGFGVFVLYVLPAAFVDLPTGQLSSLRRPQQLRVFCGGVWHNLVLSAAAYGLLQLLPHLLLPLYHHRTALVVTQLEHNSSVTGPSGLVAGDVITAVGGVRTRSEQDWERALSLAISSSPPVIATKIGSFGSSVSIMVPRWPKL